ncbi:MAG: tyrosine-type recombinase/integrase [Armatimonadetes bacterium]|nr:tyrosine-type recombinase/integrase [Armatimonadota bacterium]
MDTDFTSVTWEEALKSFLLHLKAVRAPKTVDYYQKELILLLRWANVQNIPLERFGKRHLDEYLVMRSDSGKSQSTLHHDALTAKVFMKWCARNDLISRSLLADYEVRAAPRPNMYMPTEEDVPKILSALHDIWDPNKNTDARYTSPTKRSFHRERNYALVIALLDSACRIGEVLSLKQEDFQHTKVMVKGIERAVWQITIRKSKGREPRTIPMSKDGADAIRNWLTVRNRVMKNVSKEDDEGYLFISETGGRIDEGRFLKTLKKSIRYAGLTDDITLHSLRRFSLNQLSKIDVLATQRIAGHKDTKTTLIYTRLDSGHLVDAHERASVVGNVLASKRADRKKRLV